MTGALPDTTEVAEGVWQVALPFASPLGYSFAYIVAMGDDVLLIDAGAPEEAAARKLTETLTDVGYDLASVHGIVLTHGHFDHCGLAEQIVAASGAWIALNVADWPLLRGGRRASAARELEWLRGNGVPASSLESIGRDLLALPTLVFSGDVRMLEHGDVVRAGERALEVIATPGHSPGHVCLVLREAGVVFTGDHVLPRITPLVGLWSDVATSPLGEYLAAVERIGDEGLGTALPGHEWTFEGLPERSVELREHHETRLGEVGRRAAEVESLWELGRSLEWSRPWSLLEPMGWYCALGEVASHLRELTVRGAVSEDVERRLISRSVVS